MVNWMAKRINIRPTTSVYATYKNIRYDPWTAIAEFVDNSTQSYYDNTEKLNSTKIFKTRTFTEFPSCLYWIASVPWNLNPP